MGNDLVVAPPSLDGGMDVMTLGNVLAQSGYFADARQAAQAVVKVLAGRELGFGPIASMTGIHIISGKPAIGANLMAMAVKRSGKYTYKVTVLTDEVCRLEFYERNGDKWEQLGPSEFTRQDATKAGVKNLDRFPRNMLFARALSNGVRWYCPDALAMTTYTPEELDGEFIEVKAPQVQNQYQAAPAANGTRGGSQSGPVPPLDYEDQPFQGPMTPTQLTTWLFDAAKAAENDNSSDLSDGWKGAIRGHIGKLFADKAKAFLHEVYGVESSKELTEGRWKALLRWLNIRQADDGQWHADDMAVAESKLWVAEHQ